MPRNPDKKHCAHPACRNWAMRGYDLCRPHLDPLLGPRGAGAPPGNLNALKTGQYINPASAVQLRRLATQIATRPDDFEETIAAHVSNLCAHAGSGSSTRRAVYTVIALQENMARLIPHLFDAFFVEELEFMTRHIPPQSRAAYRNDIWALCAPLSPADRLRAITQAKNDLLEQKRRKAPEQLAEHSAPSKP